MSQSITLTITEEERAELESLLDAFIAEIRKDKSEREPSAVQGYQNLDDLTGYARQLSDENRSLNERVLRLELQLDHQKEQQAAERENFHLQLENLMPRSQRGLPPRDPNAPPDEDEK